MAQLEDLRQLLEGLATREADDIGSPTANETSWDRDRMLDMVWGFVQVTAENARDNLECAESFQVSECEDALEEAWGALDYARSVYLELAGRSDLVLYAIPEKILYRQDPLTGEITDATL